MSKSRFKAMQEQVAGNFSDEKAKRIAGAMRTEYDSLCSTLEDGQDPMERHKRNNIFPAVSAFRALLAEGMDRSEAAALTDESFLILMKGPADAIRRMMKIPGAYRLMPRLWKKMMPKLFSERSGFVFDIKPTDGTRVRFDMKACPYMEACRELDCMELAPTFCTTDDVCYGSMHPKLKWNRTVTLAKDGVPCDFDLYIEDKRQRKDIR